MVWLPSRPVFYAALCILFLPLPFYLCAPLHVLKIAYIVLSFFYVVTACAVFLEALAAIPRRRLRPVRDGLREVTCIIPAYLNNEIGILDETLTAHAACEYRGPMTVMLMYNKKPGSGPKFREAERELVARWNGYSVRNLRFQVVENPSSRSKAQNVNYALDMIEARPGAVIAIYDADHHPDPDAVGYALATMDRTSCKVVQGHCAIRNVDEGFLPGVIGAEFEEVYQTVHEGRARFWNMGLFGGSNGYWDSATLKQIRMDGDMLTEDIDSSFRASLLPVKICYCYQAVSTELAPLTLKTLAHQRLRWAQGWFQVSRKYAWKCLITSKLTVRQKCACLLLLWWREIFVYFSFQMIHMMVWYALREHTLWWDWRFGGAFVAMMTLSIFKFLITLCLADGPVNGKPSATFWYFMLYIPYTGFLNFLHVIAHGKEFFGVDQWVVTTREKAGDKDGKDAALLDEDDGQYSDVEAGGHTRQGPPLGPRGSEALGLLQAEHQPLSSDGGRAFYSSHYHAERREFGNRMSDYPDMDPYGDGGAYQHLSQGLFSWDRRQSSFSASSMVRSSDDADSDAGSPANSTLYGASDAASEGLQRNSSRKLFWTGSMDSMDGLSVEQGSSGMQLSHSTAASQQSSLSSSTPKSPVLVAAKRLAFELDHLSEALRGKDASRVALPVDLARPTALKPLLQLLTCGDTKVQVPAVDLLAALPAAQKPLIGLLGCGVPCVQRPALELLIALLDISDAAPESLRSSGCIDALAKVTRAALEASEREPEEGRAMEAAADAHLSLQALWRLLSRPAETGSGNTSDGSSLLGSSPDSRQWRNFSDNLELLRLSGGAPMLVMALQNMHCADVVALALKIICAAVSETGSGKLTSKKGVLNFVTALLQANVLYAMSVVVVNVERTRLWICAGEVVRIFVHLVSADPEMVPALQQAHGLAALITLVRHDATHPELAAAARQALSFCGRQYVSPSVAISAPTPATPRASIKPQDDSDSSDSDGEGGNGEVAAAPTPYINAMRRTEAAAANRAQEGKTALHWAAQFGEPGLLHELLGPSAAADVNSADEAGNTPLHLAALNDHLECVEELLASGGDSLAYNRDYNLACDLSDSSRPVWTLLVHDMQWRTCLQTWHQCKVVWVDGMAPPLAHLPEAAALVEEEEGGEEGSLLGSLAPPPPPPAELHCHFKPLTGEVCIAEAPPTVVRQQGNDGLPARARRKAVSDKAAEAAAGAEASSELYPVPCNLGVVAMDESTIELNFSADGDEHGIVQDPELRAAVARMTIACTATDLGPALGTMLLRLFPHLFKVQEPLRKCRALHAELAALQGVMAGAMSTLAFNASAAAQLDDAARRLERRLRRVIALLDSCAAELARSAEELRAAPETSNARLQLYRNKQEAQALATYRDQVEALLRNTLGMLTTAPAAVGDQGRASDAVTVQQLPQPQEQLPPQRQQQEHGRRPQHADVSALITAKSAALRPSASVESLLDPLSRAAAAPSSIASARSSGADDKSVLSNELSVQASPAPSVNDLQLTTSLSDLTQALYKEAAPHKSPRPGRAPRPRPSPTGPATPAASMKAVGRNVASAHGPKSVRMPAASSPPAAKQGAPPRAPPTPASGTPMKTSPPSRLGPRASPFSQAGPMPGLELTSKASGSVMAPLTPSNSSTALLSSMASSVTAVSAPSAGRTSSLARAFSQSVNALN